MIFDLGLMILFPKMLGVRCCGGGLLRGVNVMNDVAICQGIALYPSRPWVQVV